MLGDRVTREEAAAYLGVSTQTMHEWASSGRHKLPYAKVGKRAWYRKSDLEAFIERQTATTAAEHRAK